VEAGPAQPLKELPLAGELELAVAGRGVDEGRQVAVGRDRGVLLAQAAGGGVAGIGEALLAVGGSGRIERLEALLGHVDLAAQFEGLVAFGQVGGGPLAQAQGHVFNRADVDGHVFAGGAVAAGRGAHEPAVFISEGDAAAVDLQLAAQVDRAPQRLVGAVDPGRKLFQAHRVVDRVHALGVHHRRELVAHVAAHALGGRIGVVELRVRGFKRAQLSHERIEGGVGYGRLVFGVIEVGIMLDLATKRLYARLGIAFRFSERFRVEQRWFRILCHECLVLSAGRAP
jgi:hypothetical protein